MGTWDIGPFDNDTAADFADDLDDAAVKERGSLIRKVLVRADRTQPYLEVPEAEVAVAAAAPVAAQCAGGAEISLPYGPEEPVPVLPEDFRQLALEALDRVMAEDSELPDLWGETGDGRRWRSGIVRLRAVLDPPPPIEVLFEA